MGLLSWLFGKTKKTDTNSNYAKYYMNPPRPMKTQPPLSQKPGIKNKGNTTNLSIKRQTVAEKIYNLSPASRVVLTRKMLDRLKCSNKKQHTEYSNYYSFNEGYYSHSNDHATLFELFMIENCMSLVQDTITDLSTNNLYLDHRDQFAKVVESFSESSSDTTPAYKVESSPDTTPAYKVESSPSHSSSSSSDSSSWHSSSSSSSSDSSSSYSSSSYSSSE